MNENLNDFLIETKYCNFKNININYLAKKLTLEYSAQQEKAKALFYWVRDNILYRVGNWNCSASETLKEKRGTCTNKTNLLIALLRSINIPAGYGVMYVMGDEYFGPIKIPIFKNLVSLKSVHIFCYIYLNNQWVKVDPSDDIKLCEATSYFNPTTKLINWDGTNDAMLNLNPKHILNEKGPINDIDRLISKKSRKSKKFFVKVGNFYIDFLRNNKENIKSINQLEFLFKKWFKKNHLFCYYIFCLVRNIMNIYDKESFKK